MKRLSVTEVQRIAGLARIGVPEERAVQLAQDVSNVLEFVDALQAVDTTGVTETSQVTGLVDVLRDDVVQPSEVSRETLLAAAPEREGDYIKVKRVL